MKRLNADRGSQHFLPHFCDLRTVLAVVLIAVFLAFVLECASFVSADDFFYFFGFRALFILWIALASTVVLCGLRPCLVSMKNRWSGFIVFMVIQLLTSLISWISIELLPMHDLLILMTPPKNISTNYYRNLGISSIVTLMLLHNLHQHFLMQQQAKAEAEARLDSLQARIRPHFLFNSLNTIASLIRNNPKMAEELLQDLAELFRASLKNKSRFVNLSNEFELVKQYLNIELHRLGHRLAIEWDIDNVPLDALIPPLILQPLVENAIYHGIQPARYGGVIIITAHKRKGSIVLVVKNSLPEDKGKELRRGNQIAMENIRARMQVCFSDEGLVLISTVDGYYQVRIAMPYRTK